MNKRIGMKSTGLKMTGLKSTGLILCTVISLFAMVGSSIWEGAAGVAVTGGDLPVTGRYIATNSFPLNTVVYVTNLENGQTTRAVTSSALEAAPGLLAILSRDAAEAIGLPNNTLGRIRMFQPPDNVAFSRFGQRRPTPRNVDIDPEAFAALLNLHPAETAGTDIADTIIDLPVVEEIQVAQAEEPPAAAEAEAEIVEYYAAEQDVQQAIAEDANQRFHHDAIALMRGFFPEPSYEIVEDLFAAETLIEEREPAEEQAVVESPFPASDYILTFTPAEHRPPTDTLVTPNPDYFIPGIVHAQPEPYLDYQPDFIDPDMIIDPIREPPLALQPVVDYYVIPEPYQVDVVQAAPDPVEMVQAEPDPVEVVQAAPDPVMPLQEELVQAEPLQEAPLAVIQPQPPAPLFPVPLINNLQAGKHYLQLASYTNAEAVHYELSRIDRIDANLARELVVKRYVNHPEHGTIYQILIGPLTFGESGALLHRFRNSTHRDAFIRTGS